MKPPGIRKAEERQRRSDAGEIYLQRWIPEILRGEINAAIDAILQRHAAEAKARDE
jgi:hypothetical protein